MIKHSIHSKIRANQRAFSQEVFNLITLFGTPFYLQGMQFYTVLKKDIPSYIDHKLRKKLKNSVVVVGKSGVAVTCYWNNNPVKYLKKKSKKFF